MLVGHLPAATFTRPAPLSSSSASPPRVSLGGVLQTCNLARREMAHFVANLSSFMMFEVRPSVPSSVCLSGVCVCLSSSRLDRMLG